ncbi:MAG: conjugal transfer protein [Gordonia amarae]
MGFIGEMVSLPRRLSRLSDWKPKMRERAVVLALVSAPVALVLSMYSVLIVRKNLHDIPKPVDVYAAITDTARVQNFARNSLLLWMAGTDTSAKPLLARSSAAKSIELSEVPFEVRSIDQADIARWSGADAAQWLVTFAVTFVSPGSGTSQINRYSVTVLEKHASYQLLMWPSIVNPDTTSFRVESKYTVGIDPKSTLSASIKQFASAYLTSGSDSTSLGRYVSAAFRGSSIVDSPYTEVEVESAKMSDGSQPLPSAKPGSRLKVLVRVKASASAQTWSIMDLALSVSLSENNVWLVDGIDAPIGWGAISDG